MSVGELGSRLRLDSGTLTPVLKRLEQAGLVTRRRDSDDERRVLVALTTAGENLEDQVSDVPTRLVGSLGLNATESRQLRKLLGSLLQRLDGEITQ
jgi:DNA-binding MarR family transcriptional regulator